MTDLTSVCRMLATALVAFALANPVFSAQPEQPVAPAATPAATATTPSSTPAATRHGSRPVPATATAADGKATPAAEKHDELVAKVVWVKGTFKATSPDNKARTLNKTDPIYLHDTLSTDKGSQAQIVFTDDSMMTFRPGTEFYIFDYKLNTKGKQDGSYIMNLIKGGFRTITGLIAKANPKQYKVITPVATIGVRGTDYAIFLAEDGQLYVGQYKGSPCVSNDKNEELCLNNSIKYANVPTAGAPPVQLTKQPAVFELKAEIVKSTFTDVGGAAPGGGTTSGGDPTGGVSLPGNSGSSTNPLSSSFCIQ